MRHAIETAPRDGKFVILEDDASGTYVVAHWSPEADDWVGKNGEPSKTTPTHWFPLARGKYLLQENEGSSNPSQVGPSELRRGYTFVDVVAAAALVGLFFYVTRDAGQQDIVRISTIGRQVVEQDTRLPSQDSGKTDVLALEQHAEADQARAQSGAQEAAQVKQAQAAKTAQSLGQEREKTAALVQEAAAARQELTASTAQHRQALDEERARGAALAGELATAQREIETQAALLRKASDEPGQLSAALASELATAQREIETQAALLTASDETAAKTAQSLGQEREKTAALAQEAAAARQELAASTAQHRQALDEERARGAALASELAQARREVETQVALLRKAGDEAVDVKQKSAAVEERPGVSLPAWANSDALVKPAQAAKQPDVTPENSKPSIKPVQTVPLPREHAMSPGNGNSCQRYRTYDPASGTYWGYDGRRHSCP